MHGLLLRMVGLSLCLIMHGRALGAPELITSWSGYNHPLSYQGRTLTRDSKGNYFAVIRGGNDVNVWKRDVLTSQWSNLGAVNAKSLSGREGECASIAVDGKDQIHVSFYDGPTPDLVHRLSDDGKVFGLPHIIQAGVTWNPTAAGGPFLHIAKDNSLHVAYVSETGEKPYYANSVDQGTSWSTHKVSDLGNSSLRPSVITTSSGRIVFGYSAHTFHSAYSDDGGKLWTDASPPIAGIAEIVNCRLIGNGDAVYVTGQKIDPAPRGILASACLGKDMKWGNWETVFSGSGADASMFIDAEGNRNILWRQYPDTPNLLYLSTNKGGWQRKAVDVPSTDYLLPYAYWQEFFRGQPGQNQIALLAPDVTSLKAYFVQIPITYLPDGATTILPLPKSKSKGVAKPAQPRCPNCSGWYDARGKEREPFRSFEVLRLFSVGFLSNFALRK
jgi:hypothetical protein